jgi:hypothetical protein
LCPLVQELVPHSLKPVLQPPVIGPQGLHEGVEGIVLLLVPVAFRAQLSEAVVPLRSPALWSVRNVVPTLTSSKRRGLSLNGRC